MNNFLNRITDRHFGQSALVQPRQRSRFEGATAPSFFAESETTQISGVEQPSEKIQSKATGLPDPSLSLPVASTTEVITTVNDITDHGDQELKELPTAVVVKQTNNFSDPLPALSKKENKLKTDALENTGLKKWPLPLAEEAQHKTPNASSDEKTMMKTPAVAGEGKKTPQLPRHNLPNVSSVPQNVPNQPTVAPQQVQQRPVVKIRIGKIEVKAANDKKPVKRKTRPSSSTPKLTLEQYLNKREE